MFLAGVSFTAAAVASAAEMEMIYGAHKET
jgi:hypothetical protein